MNQSEWKDRFLLTLTAYHEVIINSLVPNQQKSKINPETFFSTYKKMILNRLNSLNSNTFFDKIDYSEYRLVSLISCLHTAKQKFKNNSLKTNNNQQSNSSQFLKVNNIIKNSFELTSFIYILEWLQKIYQKDRNLINEKIEFSKVNNGFHPDLLNQNGALNEINKKKYDNLMSNVISFIRRGEYVKAQENAEFNNQFFLSSILEGGLPLNDFSIDSNELLIDIDFDLFPPYMKNIEFNEIKNEVNNLKLNGVYGNQNWTLWLSSFYESSELWDSEFSLQLNKMSSVISGSEFLNKNYQESIDDILYRNILFLFNSCLLERYANEKKSIDYYYSTEGNITKIINAQNGKTIDDVLSFIQNTEEFISLFNTDYSLELEFDLIKLHFLSHSSDFEKYQKSFSLIFQKILHLSKTSDQLLKINTIKINQIQDTMFQKAKVTRYTDNEYLLEINYLKMLFVMLISFIGTNDDNENKDLLKDIFNFNDDIISLYCYKLFYVTTNPILIVYITSFMFHLDNSQKILEKLANLLNENHQKYQLFVDEIEKYFSSNREKVSIFLANNTSIFKIDSEITTIDLALEKKIMSFDNPKVIDISNIDITKINQLQILFTEKNINNDILLKYLLLFTFKFLAVNKINEVQIINNTFTNNLTSAIKNEITINIFNDELEAFYTQLNLNEIQNMAIRSCIILIREIINCFNSYADIIYQTKKQFLSSIRILNNQHLNEEIMLSFESLHTLIRLLITNKTMTNFLTIFFGEELYESVFKKIINDWIYQIIKWICEIKIKDIFLPKHIVSEIDDTFYEIYKLTILNERMIADCIVKKLSGIYDGITLNKEETYFEFVCKDNKIEILKLLYKVATKNIVYLKEIFDQKASIGLLKDIDKLDF